MLQKQALLQRLVAFYLLCASSAAVETCSSPVTRPTALLSHPRVSSCPWFSNPAESITFYFLSQAYNFSWDLSPFRQNKLLLPKDLVSPFLRSFLGNLART